LLNAAGRRVFSQHMDKYRATDPLYEEYTDNRGKVKRRKRALPEGLSQRDTKILKSVNRRAYHLDRGLNVGGIRFGWTFIIGIVPGAGDAADALLGYTLVIRKAREADIPPWLIQRMLLNLAIGTGIGLVPVVGDIALAMWRANWRNARLLEEYLRQRGLGHTEAESATAAVASTSASASAVDKKKSGSVTKRAAGSGKEKAVAGPAVDVAATRPPAETVPGAEKLTPGSSTSGGSGKRWKMWRRGSSKDKVNAASSSQAPGTPNRDSRFVENLDAPPPKQVK